MTPPVTAVVVNYNAGDHLLRCVRSLRAEGVERVIVVDNASSDGSVASLAREDPGVRVMRVGANLGFGTAANRGTAGAETEFLLVLNPDTLVEPGMVKALLAVMEREPRAGIVGPAIENPDGTRYPSARTFPSFGDAVGHAVFGMVAPGNRFTRRYRMLGEEPVAATRVDWVSGACMLTRRRCFEDLGGFDESYFMYVEDVDLCWRAGRAGWAVLYEPSARLVHLQGLSANQHAYRMIAEHHRSLLRFWWRTSPRRQRPLAPLVALGVVLRMVAGWVQHALSTR